MTQDIGRDENRFNNEPYGMTRGEFAEWCIKQDAWSKGEMLPAGYVKQWTFWLFVNDIPAGYGRLYAVSKKFRGNGYGTYLFRSLLKIACELGLATVLSTVEKVNPASKAVHEKCGGVIVDENAERWFFSFSDTMRALKA